MESSRSADNVSTTGIRRAFSLFPFSTTLSTGFGVGLVPLAPGTAGSALGLALAWSLSQALRPASAPSVAAAVGLLMSGLLIGFAAIPLVTRACRGLGAKDPGCVVLDEVAGQFLSSAPVPAFAYASPLAEAGFWIASFLLFRLFDIWKPGPIRGLQRLPEGLGVVVDDLLSGAAAGTLTLALAWGWTALLVS